MTNFHSYLTAENLLLFASILLGQTASSIFTISAMEPPPGFETLDSFTLLYALCYWLHADSLRRNFAWPYCRGVFVYAAGFVVIPYYLFKTRGAKALLTLIIFASMYGVSTLLGMIVSTLLLAPRFD